VLDAGAAVTEEDVARVGGVEKRDLVAEVPLDKPSLKALPVEVERGICEEFGAGDEGFGVSEEFDPPPINDRKKPPDFFV